MKLIGPKIRSNITKKCFRKFKIGYSGTVLTKEDKYKKLLDTQVIDSQLSQLINYYFDLGGIVANANGSGSSIPTPTTEGLIAYYPFNGNANDESGNGRHLTVNGAILTQDNKGIPDSAYYFNGNSSLTIDNVSSWAFNQRLTSCLWAKPDFTGISGNVDYTYFHITGDWGRGKGVDMVGNVNKFRMRINNWGGFTDISLNVNNNLVWNFYCGTYDGNKFTIYLNGVKGNQIDYNGSISYSSSYPNFGIGKRAVPGYPHYMLGSIDNVRLYDRALAEEEILSIYNYEK